MVPSTAVRPDFLRNLTCFPIGLVFYRLVFAAALFALCIACSGESAPAATMAPVLTATTPTATAEPTTARPTETPSPTPTAKATAIPPTSAPTVTPVPTARPRPEGPLVSLPEDEAPHETPVEWWYFNGFLRDGEGNEYSFHFVTFQSPTLPIGTPHLLHATLGDHGRGVHGSGERGTLATLDPDAPSVEVNAEGWVMWGDGAKYKLSFDLGGTALELEAASSRDAILHDSTGLVYLGDAGETYYYSRTRMEYDGWLEDGDGRRPASGSGWMDHQWGDISRADVGWDWVNLQLEDGSDIMVAVVWKPTRRESAPGGDPAPVQAERVAAYATFVAPDGAVSHVPGEDVSLEATGSWASPETDIVYPMEWLLRVAPLELELALAPVLEQAEFAAGAILPVVYWEGAVTAVGSRGGEPLAGRGFVELVGYDPGQATAVVPMP